MKLHFRTVGTGKPLIVLHGLFGSGDNWITVGKALSIDFQVYLVDLRNHGHSPHSHDFSYKTMEEDLLVLIDLENLNKPHILGHSMGGKVARHRLSWFQGRWFLSGRSQCRPLRWISCH